MNARKTFWVGLALVSVGMGVAFAQTATYFAKVAVGARPDVMVVNGSTVTSQLESNSDTQSIVESHTHSATAGNGAVYYGARSRGTSAAPTIVQNGDQVLAVSGVAYDGTDYGVAAALVASISGTPGNNNTPGQWQLCTTPSGAATPTNCVTEDPNGKWLTLASSTTSAGLTLPHGAAPTSPVNGDLWTTTAGLFARINGATVGPLSAGTAQTTGTFTASWDTGFTTTPTNNWQYTITGNIVTVTDLTIVTGTSNATTFQATTTNGLPSAIRPASSRIIYGFNATDNGAATIGCIQLTSTGTMTLFKGSNCVAASAWTNTGSKQLRVDGLNTFTYELTP